MKEILDPFLALLGISEYPVLFRYTDELPLGTLFPAAGSRVCLFALLAKTRAEGRPVALSASHHGCPGGGYYLGFLSSPREGIEHFLSCGIPGKMEGERYLKTPEIARIRLGGIPARPARARYGLFTRGDGAQQGEEPDVVIFFAPPDLLAGLHFLAGYGRDDEAVTAPFSSGCGGIVTFPLAEGATPRPRAVLGLFDPSARPHVEKDRMTFAVPYRLFREMAANAGESFLVTGTWQVLRKRLAT